MIFLLKGIVLGFSIAAPVGPIGVLCIRRTLASGAATGLATSLGVATADAVYGVIAGFGITVLSGFLLEHQVYLRFIGGLFLLYLGYTTFKSNPGEIAAKASEAGLLGAYVSSFFLTITNPLTILSFAAVFAGLGLGDARGEGSYLLAICLVLGVFIGSMLWWLTLIGLVSKLRSQFDQKHLKWVNQVSGLIIAGFGVFSLLSILV